MAKKIFGLIAFVAVILIIVFSVKECSDKPSRNRELPAVEQGIESEEQINAKDSMNVKDSVDEVRAEDLILDMVGVDTIRVD